jgi:osmotically inducible protein OsmC
METTRSAMAVWQGDLLNGSGTVSAGTGLFSDLPTSWSSRTEAPNGRTSPEELLAAAHSSCFSMAFSNILAKAGFPPERVEVRSDVTFEKQESGWSVIRSALTVKAKVPGIDKAAFDQAGESARTGCPISRALNPSIEVTLDATLEN